MSIQIYLEELIKNTRGKEQENAVKMYNDFLNKGIKKSLNDGLKKGIPYWIYEDGNMLEVKKENTNE